jgi:uncharacterized tellurite resistance protein B-like protein
MFGQWLRRASVSEQVEGAEQIHAALRRELPEMDEESLLVTTAIVGLLGAVAYADGDYSQVEQQRVQEELSRIEGLSRPGVEAVCEALKRHIVEVSTVQLPHYSRVLRELADPELRLQVLEMLLALAAADQSITSPETNVMRQIATALGLTQRDYNTAQQKYREHLSVLKPEG